MTTSRTNGHTGRGSKTRKKHERCRDCSARRVHVRVGSETWECMACGTRSRQGT